MFHNSRTLDILLEKILMHSFRSKTHILGIFTPFRCSTTSIWFRTTYFTSKIRVLGGFAHEFMPLKPFLVLSQRTCPIHYFSLKLMFWVVPCHFVAALDTLQKPVLRCI